MGGFMDRLLSLLRVFVLAVGLSGFVPTVVSSALLPPEELGDGTNVGPFALAKTTPDDTGIVCDSSSDPAQPVQCYKNGRPYFVRPGALLTGYRNGVGVTPFGTDPDPNWHVPAYGNPNFTKTDPVAVGPTGMISFETRIAKFYRKPVDIRNCLANPGEIGCTPEIKLSNFQMLSGIVFGDMCRANVFFPSGFDPGKQYPFVLNTTGFGLPLNQSIGFREGDMDVALGYVAKGAVWIQYACGTDSIGTDATRDAVLAFLRKAMGLWSTTQPPDRKVAFVGTSRGGMEALSLAFHMAKRPQYWDILVAGVWANMPVVAVGDLVGVPVSTYPGIGYARNLVSNQRTAFRDESKDALIRSVLLGPGGPNVFYPRTVVGQFVSVLNDPSALGWIRGIPVISVTGSAFDSFTPFGQVLTLCGVVDNSQRLGNFTCNLLYGGHHGSNFSLTLGNSFTRAIANLSANRPVVTEGYHLRVWKPANLTINPNTGDYPWKLAAVTRLPFSMSVPYLAVNGKPSWVQVNGVLGTTVRVDADINGTVHSCQLTIGGDFSRSTCPDTLFGFAPQTFAAPYSATVTFTPQGIPKGTLKWRLFSWDGNWVPVTMKTALPNKSGKAVPFRSVIGPEPVRLPGYVHPAAGGALYVGFGAYESK